MFFTPGLVVAGKCWSFANSHIITDALTYTKVFGFNVLATAPVTIVAPPAFNDNQGSN